MTPPLSFLSFRLHTLNADASGLTKTAHRGLGPAAIIIPRALCRFERIFMARRDRNGRKAAGLQSLETSPHEETGHFLHKQGSGDGPGYFALWQWNGVAIRSTLPTDDMVLIPETHAHPTLTQGIRLVKMIAGCEAQYWQDSEIVTSRWWPHQPSERDWAIFLQGLSLDDQDLDTASLDYPKQPLTLPWRTDLNLFNTPFDATKPLLSPRRVGLAAAALAVIMIAIPFGQSMRLDSRLGELQQALADDPRDLQRLTSLRQGTLTNLNLIQDADALKASAEVPDILLELSSVLGSSDARIDGFSYGENRIEVRLNNGPSAQLPDLIGQLEALPGWTSVNARTDTNNIIVIEALRVEGMNETGS